MAGDRRLLLALATVVAVAGAVYLNSLGNRFALDDEAIIATNPQVHGVERIPEAVTGSYWPGAGARGLYRPLSLATYAIDWELWDGDPFGFHLVNVLLHAAVSALVLLLLLGIGAALPAAWAGALVFAVHPVHVEAVANVVGRAEVLASLFLLAACVVYLKGRGGWRTAGPVALLYLLSLLSKETGITLPAVLMLLHWAEKGDVREAAKAILRRWPVFAAMATALGLYLALRVVNIGTFLGVEASPWFWGLPDRARILTAIRVWPEYLRLMLVPLDLVPDYGPAVITPQLDPFAPLVVLGALLGVLTVLVAWRARRTAPLLTATIAWFAVTVLPVAGVLFPVGVILAERTLYLPSVAVALAVAAVARWVGAREGLTRPALAALMGVLVLGGVRTWTGNLVWRDSLAVMNHLLDHHPENFRVQWGVADHFAARGDTAAALAHMELATRMVPGQVRVRDRYGELLLAASPERSSAGPRR